MAYILSPMKNASESPVRVRFAPSPTGYLHVGGARTALFCYLYAKHNGGQFILRVEDTDQERSTEESMKMQINDLQWLGLAYDEGIDPATLKDFGPYGPYRQSQRLDIYRKYADQLLKSGHAYYCFMTEAEIEAQKQKATAEGRPPQIDSPYRELSLADAEKKIADGETAVIRFRVQSAKSEYVLNDLVRGEVKFPSDMVGDFVLLRSGGMPVYNFCCVIDDALMKMSHVLRAEEHLSNTLRQMMIYEALGFAVPQFGHLSIILGSDRQKLSKRHGATSVHEYATRGYLPEALNNFIALLGWSSPKAQEILSMDEMIEQFSLDRLNPAAAVFDEVKLKWMNSQHLRALPHEELWSRLQPFFREAGLSFSDDQEWQNRALEVFKTSMEVLIDAVELFRPLAKGALQIDESSKDAMSWAKTKEVVQAWRQLVADHPNRFIEEAEFVAIQDQVKNTCGVKGKELFMPIRVAVIGKPQGAELKILVPLLPKEQLLERADQVLEKL